MKKKLEELEKFVEESRERDQKNFGVGQFRTIGFRINKIKFKMKELEGLINKKQNNFYH